MRRAVAMSVLCVLLTAGYGTADAAVSYQGQDGSAPIVGMLSEGDARKFEPAELTIPKGTTVTWQHVSGSTHTATADPSRVSDPANVALPEGIEPWDSGNLTGGQTWSYTFDVPGTYRYFCAPHEGRGMVGTITVTE
jgi:plastocyanin